MKPYVMLVAVVLLSAVASAQSLVPKQDEQEIREYRLTMPVFKQIAKAVETMLETMKNDPRAKQAAKLEAEIEAINKKDELTEADEARLEKLQAELETLEDQNDAGFNNAKSLDDMEAAILKSPHYVAALKSAGLTPRDFSKFMLAYMQAAFVHGFMKAGTIKEMPKEVNAENVKFIADNEAQIEALFKKFQEAGKPKP